MTVGPLEDLGVGAQGEIGILARKLMEPIGYVVFWVRVDRVSGYDEGQVTLIMTDTLAFMSQVPVVLESPMINQVA